MTETRSEVHTTSRRPGLAPLAVAGLCFLAVSCADDDMAGLAGVGTWQQPDTYWHTRTRSAAEQQTMLRSHGVGFSFDAINGERCDVGSVKCQVLNLDALDAAGAYLIDNTQHSESETSTSRSFAEYLRNVNTATGVSGGVLIYKGSYMKTASIFERSLDTTMCFTSVISERVAEKYIDTNMIDVLFEDNPRQYLSDNFLYAIDKLRRGGIEDVAVVDSFIDIFGTHVITGSTVGGRLQLDVLTSRKGVNTFIQEKQVEESSLDLFFKKTVSTMTEEELKAATALLDNAEMHLTVVGGDLSHMNTLVANPSFGNIDATPEALSRWQESVSLDAAQPWNSRCEMPDMEVTPIWELIPDAELAALVRTRIEATAPTMQELYGNRNFLNVEIPVGFGAVSTTFGGRLMTVADPWVVDVIAANRHVATVCKEWVPEIDPRGSVRVVYPIYENRIQTDAGLCVHNGVAYRVKWLYNRFSVEPADTVATDKVYLTFGYLDPAPTGGVSYQSGLLRLGYEWPGSIATDGSLANRGEVRTTRKFLGHFYLDSEKNYANLPNWTYQTVAPDNRHYEEEYAAQFAAGLPYTLSGVGLAGRSGAANLVNRMVRDDDYVYYINTTEVSK